MIFLFSPNGVPSKIINLYSCFLSYIGCFYFFIYFLIIKFLIASESIIVIFLFLLILIVILKYMLVVIVSGAVLFSFCWLLLSVNFKFFPISCTGVYFSCNRYRLDGIRTIFLCDSAPSSEVVYILSNMLVYNGRACYILLSVVFVAIVLTWIGSILEIFGDSACRWDINSIGYFDIYSTDNHIFVWRKNSLYFFLLDSVFCIPCYNIRCDAVIHNIDIVGYSFSIQLGWSNFFFSNLYFFGFPLYCVPA